MHRSLRTTWFVLILMGVLACLHACAATAGVIEIEVVLQPEHTGVTIPMSVNASDQLAGITPSRISYRLVEQTSGESIPCHVDTSTGDIHFQIETPVSDRSITKRYVLDTDARAGDALMEVRYKGREYLNITEDGHPVMTYIYRDVLAEGIPEDRRRSCYFHPVHGLDGEVLTDDFAVDHPHHRGLSWMWPQVRFGEHSFDLWHMRGIRQRFEELLTRDAGSVFGTVGSRNGWFLDHGQKVLVEMVTARVYRAGSSGRVVDIELVLDPVDEPITLGSSGTGYGGFSFRFGPREDTVLHTSDGRIEADSDRIRYLWSDLSARFEGSASMSGVAIFDHPENPSHPTGWTLRFYGILQPSFTAVEPLTINPGEPLRLRYRVWIHRGDVDAGHVSRAYNAYMQPPEATVISTGQGD